MIITCNNCSTSFNLSDELVKETGSKVRCSKCHYVFQVYPPNVFKETEASGNTFSTEFPESKMNGSGVSEKLPPSQPSKQKRDDENDFLFDSDSVNDDDFDLSEIDKMLREDEATLIRDNGLFHQTEDQKDEHEFEFEFGDLEELFAEEDQLEDSENKEDMLSSDRETDKNLLSDKHSSEELDLSELDDFFKEDQTWKGDFLETELELDNSGVGFEKESEKILEPPEPEDMEHDEHIEDSESIDFSELDQLFGEDESKSFDLSEFTRDIEMIAESETSDSGADVDKVPIDDNEISLDEFSGIMDGQPDIRTEIEADTESDLDLVMEKDEDALGLEFDLDSESEGESKNELTFDQEEGDLKFDFDLELESEDDSREEAVLDQEEDDDLKFDFDLELESEGDAKHETVTDRHEEKTDFGLDPEGALSDDKMELESFESEEFDLDHEGEQAIVGSDTIGQNGQDLPLSVARTEDQEFKIDFEFDVEDSEKEVGKTHSDEEFDLSDLEDIIDLEEESKTEAGSSEMDNEELDFDLALEPDDEKWTSPKVVLEGETIEFDKTKASVETDSDFQLKDFEYEKDLYDEKVLEADLKENDDYQLEENQQRFQNAFETVTLMGHSHQEEQENVNMATREEKPEKRMGKPVFVILVLFILAAAGYGAYSVISMMGIQIPFIGDYLKDKTPDSGNLKMVISDLNSRFIDNNNAGKIFIITGMVKNEYAEPRSFIKVTGKLYQSGRQLSHTQQVYAGNTITDLELRSLDLDVIKTRLQNRSGINKTNVNIQPGQSVPFIIVFSNLTQTLEEFTVEIESSSRS